jgi:hypothetical protein
MGIFFLHLLLTSDEQELAAGIYALHNYIESLDYFAY